MQSTVLLRSRLLTASKADSGKGVCLSNSISFANSMASPNPMGDPCLEGGLKMCSKDDAMTASLRRGEMGSRPGGESEEESEGDESDGSRHKGIPETAGEGDLMVSDLSFGEYLTIRKNSKMSDSSVGDPRRSLSVPVWRDTNGAKKSATLETY